MATKRKTKAGGPKPPGKRRSKKAPSPASVELEGDVVAAPEAAAEPTAADLAAAKAKVPPPPKSSTALSLRDPFLADLREVPR